MATAVATAPARTTLKLKTSMFSFLKCFRCLYLEVIHGITQPSGPSGFGDLMRYKSEQFEFLKDKSLHILGKAFPKGKIFKTNGRFNSLSIAALGADVVLTGAYDMLIALEGGGYALAAFKTSDPTKNLGEYAKQLNAIAYALERKDKEPVTVTQLGIFVFQPTAFLQNKSTEEIYQWVDVPLDSHSFKNQLQDVVDALTGKCPEAGIDDKGKLCEYCARDMKVKELDC